MNVVPTTKYTPVYGTVNEKSAIEGILKAQQDQEGDIDTVTVGDNPASSCHSRGEALSLGKHARDGLEEFPAAAAAVALVISEGNGACVVHG